MRVQNKKRVERANAMILVIAKDIQDGTSETGYRYIKKRYNVSSDVVKAAREKAGVKVLTRSEITAKARAVKKNPLMARSDPTSSSEMMYRPNNINYLTVAWV